MFLLGISGWTNHKSIRSSNRQMNAPVYITNDNWAINGAYNIRATD